jgi:hypothetical protein
MARKHTYSYYLKGHAEQHRREKHHKTFEDFKDRPNLKANYYEIVKYEVRPDNKKANINHIISQIQGLTKTIASTSSPPPTVPTAKGCPSIVKSHTAASRLLPLI